MAELQIPHDDAIKDAPDLQEPRLEAPGATPGGDTTTVRRRRGRGSSKPEPEAQHADPGAVQKALHSLFKLGARVTHSDAEFQPAEFGSTATALVDLARRFPPLGVVLIALSPVVVVVDLIDKVVRIKQGIPHRNPDPAVPDDGIRPFPQQRQTG